MRTWLTTRPPFSIFMGEEVEASVSLRYLNQPKSENRTKYQVDAKLAGALVAGLMDEGFDPAYSKRTRYDGGLGHAFARVLKFLTPDASRRIIPVMVNTYYPRGTVSPSMRPIRRRVGEADRSFPKRGSSRRDCLRGTQPHQDR